jgi:hypothetical protein
MINIIVYMSNYPNVDMTCEFAHSYLYLLIKLTC